MAVMLLQRVNAHRAVMNTRRAAKTQAIRRFSTSKANKEGDKGFFGRDWKIPAATGFAFIGFLQWYHLNHPTDKERKTYPAPALLRLPGDQTAFELTMITERQLESLKLFPYRSISRLWGAINDKELPVWLRAPLYKAWTYVYDCKLDEMRYPLESYANLGEFFSRPLKDGVRQFDMNSAHLPSPVDGTVASIGIVDDSTEVPTLEQIKGARYRLDEFLGDLPSFFTTKHRQDSNTKVFHCVLYLAPGDYHRIHAPIDWSVLERRHFPGNLFPVNKIAARLIPSLFVENERVALLGDWDHGFFSLTAVGATNVGSIILSNEPEFRTNLKEQDVLVGKYFTKVYQTPVAAERGNEMAQFKLGSTVVLVFEAPANFEFTIKPGDKGTEKMLLNVSIDETYLLTAAATVLSACVLLYTHTACIRVVHHKRIVAGKSALNSFLVRGMQPVLDKYSPTWWTNSHIQVLLTFLVPQARIKYMREVLVLRDGGHASLDWALYNDDKHRLTPESPIAVILHGLTGCSASMRSLCAEALENGYRPVVFNKRGHGGLKLATPKLQEFGCVQDLMEGIQQIERTYPLAKLYGIGLSAGSGLLCSYLGETGDACRFEAGVLISPGYNAHDLFCRGKMRPMYDFLMTFSLKQLLLNHRAELKDVIDIGRALKATSIREFDEHVYMKMHGYSDLDAYWTKNNPMRDIQNIRRPLLCINALDDPVCTKETIPYEKFHMNPTAMLVETGEGSHCAFFEGHVMLKSWSNEAAMTYLNRLREYEQCRAY